MIILSLQILDGSFLLKKSTNLMTASLGKEAAATAFLVYTIELCAI